MELHVVEDTALVVDDAAIIQKFNVELRDKFVPDFAFCFARSVSGHTRIITRRNSGNREQNEEKVLALLNSCRNGLTAREISEFLEIDYVTISPLLRPMARKGLIHEAGMKENGATGHKALLWKAGPSAGWLPGRSMPAMPRKQERDFRWFTGEEILDLNKRASRHVDDFARLLNAEIAERLGGRYEN